MRKLAMLFAIMFIALPFSGCDKQSTQDKDESRLTVAVTILPQKAFVQAVGGDLVDIIAIVPAGGSPENYEPTARQLEQFAEADIYFTIGVPAEQAKILPELEGTVVVRLEEKAAEVYEYRFFEGDSRDPHSWLSVKRAIIMVETIAEELGILDPENKQAYSENAAEYVGSLREADEYAEQLFASVDDGVFLVYHPAFGYFADDYGLTMYSLEEEGKEASPQDLQDMIDFAREKDIKVLFTQPESGATQPTVFADEVGGRVVTLDPLSEDYISNFKYIAEQIAEAIK